MRQYRNNLNHKIGDFKKKLYFNTKFRNLNFEVCSFFFGVLKFGEKISEWKKIM